MAAGSWGGRDRHSSGNNAQGAVAANGGAIELSNCTISTFGGPAFGVITAGRGIKLHCYRSRIETHGDRSAGVFAHGFARLHHARRYRRSHTRPIGDGRRRRRGRYFNHTRLSNQRRLTWRCARGRAARKRARSLPLTSRFEAKGAMPSRLLRWRSDDQRWLGHRQPRRQAADYSRRAAEAPLPPTTASHRLRPWSWRRCPRWRVDHLGERDPAGDRHRQRHRGRRPRILDQATGTTITSLLGDGAVIVSGGIADLTNTNVTAGVNGVSLRPSNGQSSAVTVAGGSIRSAISAVHVFSGTHSLAVSSGAQLLADNNTLVEVLDGASLTPPSTTSISSAHSPQHRPACSTSRCRTTHRSTAPSRTAPRRPSTPVRPGRSPATPMSNPSPSPAPSASPNPAPASSRPSPSTATTPATAARSPSTRTSPPTTPAPIA